MVQLTNFRSVFYNINGLLQEYFPKIKCFKPSIYWNRYKICFYSVINLIFGIKFCPCKFNFFRLKIAKSRTESDKENRLDVLSLVYFFFNKFDYQSLWMQRGIMMGKHEFSNTYLKNSGKHWWSIRL